MSMCKVVSCVVGRGCLLWPVWSLGQTLLTFAMLHFVPQVQTYLLLQVSIDFLLLHSSPLWWKGHLFLVLVLEGLAGLHESLKFSISGWGIDLDYCDVEWFALWLDSNYLGLREAQYLEELEVVTESCVEVQEINEDDYLVIIRFTPTVPHCSLATLIGKVLDKDIYILILNYSSWYWSTVTISIMDHTLWFTECFQ